MIKQIGGWLGPPRPSHTCIYQCQWDHDAVLREMTFDRQLLDEYTIDRVIFAHRHATEAELRHVRKLWNLAGFTRHSRTGPQENAYRGREKIVDSWRTIAWELSVEHGDPHDACKQAMPDGRLVLGGTCVAGGLLVVTVSNQTTPSKPFAADVVYEDC
jgi:hypothetical protein